jgi:uncharacterized protein
MAQQTADVLIVGAGGAGIGAAIEAAQAGARVIVVDAAGQAGGTARTAGGGTWIAGSPLHQRLGIEDSVANGLADWLAWGGDAVDVEWAERYVAAGVPELYVWLAELGVEWVNLNLQEGNRVPRWHAPLGGGLGVMRVLERASRTYPNIEWHFETRLTDLVVEAGRVVGALARGPAGPVEYRAEAVLIASGGFNNNLEMVQQHLAANGQVERVLLGGGRGARGEGHRLLERVQARFVNLDAIWIYPYATPDYRDPSGRRGLVLRGLEGDVWVNRQGRRFHNEAKRGGATGAPALLAQEPATCWTIIDASIAARFNAADPYYRQGDEDLRDHLYELLDNSPFIAKGNTIAELADAAGFERGPLGETIADHNRLRASGVPTDPDFGRPLAGLAPLDQPPFYAIQFFPLARKNLGGVRTDLACRVVDQSDRPIAGLFAAGEVAGMAGGQINGRAALEGTMFGPSIYSGRVAGRCMVGRPAPVG